MDEKLKRLATKIVDLITGEIKTPQDCFDKFAIVYKQQYDYFQNFEPSNLLKLIFYIYSFKNTGNFKLAESLLNKSSFATLFRTDSDYYEETCNDCGGNGDIRCHVCDGNGTIDCGDCNGSGEDEEGESCNYCQGGGDVECPECGGTGSFTCITCDGSGQVETADNPFYFYFIITWNNFIKNRCELEAGTMTPALSEYDFDRLQDDFIILGYDEDHAEFRSAVISNEYYCTTYNDEPELYRNHSSALGFWGEDNGMENYTL